MKEKLWSLLGFLLFLGLPVVLALCWMPTSERPINWQIFRYWMASRFMNYAGFCGLISAMLILAILARLVGGLKVFNWFGHQWRLIILTIVANGFICLFIFSPPGVMGDLEDMWFRIQALPFDDPTFPEVGGVCFCTTTLILWVADSARWKFSFKVGKLLISGSLILWGYLMGVTLSIIFQAMTFFN